MLVCPCCSDSLLRHARAGGFYFFCQRCHLEMPELNSHEEIGLHAAVSETLSAQPVLSPDNVHSVTPLARPLQGA